MSDVSTLDDLARAIANSSPKIRNYAIAQADVTQQQDRKLSELDHNLLMLLARVEALELEPPPPDPVDDGRLLWTPPTLTSPLNKALTNASRTVGTGSGQDYNVTCAETLTGSTGEWNGYGDVKMIGGRMRGGSANSSGHIIPRSLSGTFHLEGWDILLDVHADAIALRQDCPIVQIQNCYIEVTDDGTSYHADCTQTQVARVGSLRYDKCTLVSDYQGVVMINEPPIPPPGSQAQSFVNECIISRTIFRPGALGRGMYIYRSIPPKAGCLPMGPMYLYDVWMPNNLPLSSVYPSGDFRAWTGVDHKYGCFLTTKLHANGNTYPFLRFSLPTDTVPTGSFAGQPASDCGVRGDGGIWLYTDGGSPPSGLNLGNDANAGLSYVSPGYQ